jgi:hypothetical protein
MSTEKPKKSTNAATGFFPLYFAPGEVETATGKEEGIVEGEEETMLPTLTKIFLLEGHKTSDTGVKIRLFRSFKMSFCSKYKKGYAVCT